MSACMNLSQCIEPLHRRWTPADERRLNHLIEQQRDVWSECDDPLEYMHAWRRTFLSERRNFPTTQSRYPHPYQRGRRFAMRSVPLSRKH